MFDKSHMGSLTRMAMGVGMLRVGDFLCVWFCIGLSACPHERIIIMCASPHRFEWCECDMKDDTVVKEV